MKRLVVMVLLLACIAGVAYASFTGKKKKASVEQQKVEKKKKCTRTCAFS